VLNYCEGNFGNISCDFHQLLVHRVRCLLRWQGRSKDAIECWDSNHAGGACCALICSHFNSRYLNIKVICSHCFKFHLHPRVFIFPFIILD
jgi:hypothetical protein